MNNIALITKNKNAVVGFTSPEARDRFSVRGFFASIFRSINRFESIATFLAKNMQSTIRTSCHPKSSQLI